MKKLVQIVKWIEFGLYNSIAQELFAKCFIVKRLYMLFEISHINTVIYVCQINKKWNCVGENNCQTLRCDKS